MSTGFLLTGLALLGVAAGIAVLWALWQLWAKAEPGDDGWSDE